MSSELTMVEEGRALIEAEKTTGVEFYSHDGTAPVAVMPATDTIESRREVQRAFEAMAEWSPAGAYKLRNSWGADAEANLRFARAFADQHSDIISVLEDRYPGMLDHPALVEASAMLGRRYARVPGDFKTVTGADRMNSTGDNATRQALDKLRDEIAMEQAKGNHSRANALYQQEQEIIAATKGNQPIINGRRTA